MIDSHFALSVEDIEKLRSLKNSPSYSEYMRSIVKSPLYSQMLLEHVNDIDVTEDIKELKDIKASPKQYNDVFKTVLLKLANRITADTIILKEIMDSKVEDVKSNLEEDFRIRYLMGLADKKYYKDAERSIETIDPNSILYKGLVNYLKKSGKAIKKEKDNSIRTLKNKEVRRTSEVKKEEKIERKSIDITGPKIEL